MTGEDPGLTTSQKVLAARELLVALLKMIVWFPLVFFHLFFTQLPLIRMRFRGGPGLVLLLAASFLFIFYIFFGAAFFPLIILLVLAPAILASELLARRVPLGRFALIYMLIFLIMSFLSNRLFLPKETARPAGETEETAAPESLLAEKVLTSMFEDMDNAQKKQFLDFNRRIYPASAAIGAMIAAILNIAVLRKFKYYAPVPIDRDWRFSTLKIPDYFLFVFLFFGLLLLLKYPPGSGIALNGFILAVFIYFLQGLAVLNHYLAVYKADVVIRILTYVAIVVFALWIILALVGLFDTWFNFRKFEKAMESIKKDR
jgi:hypothetical protein